MKKINNILLVHTGGIGDLIMARPAIQLVSSKYKSASVDFLGNPGMLDILRQDEWIDKFIPIPSRKKTIVTIMQMLIILLKLRCVKYDYLFLLQPVLNKNSHQRLKFFVKVISAKTSIGRRSNFGGNFLDVAVTENAAIHEVERMISVVSEGGIETGGFFQYNLPDTFDGEIKHIPYDFNKAFAILSPGGIKMFRRWPVAHFLELASRFYSQGMGVVFIGDSQERDILLGKESQLPEGALNLIGETNLYQLITLIRKSKIVVANDSGPMHLANALNVPVVGVFGSGDAVRTRPYLMEKARIIDSQTIDCKPCYSQKCKLPRCMEEISLDCVWKAAMDLLK